MNAKCQVLIPFVVFIISALQNTLDSLLAASSLIEKANAKKKNLKKSDIYEETFAT